ncbi:hypothetical protein J6S88_00475 [bacterium]|nr:hypothetical protein [bacterium]
MKDDAIPAVSSVKLDNKDVTGNPQQTPPVVPKFDFNFADVLHKMFGDSGDSGANALVG